MTEELAADKPIWIRARKVRARYDDLPHSTLYAKIKSGELPAPEYPLGPGMPLWRVATLEQFEQRSAAKAAE